MKLNNSTLYSRKMNNILITYNEYTGENILLIPTFFIQLFKI